MAVQAALTWLLTVHTWWPLSVCVWLPGILSVIAVIAVVAAARKTPTHLAISWPHHLDVLSGALLATLLAVFFWQSLFTGHGLLPSDALAEIPPWHAVMDGKATNRVLADQFFRINPVKHWFHQRLRDGELALWNPHLCCGVPTIGASQFGLLFPLHLLLTPLDPFHASAVAAFLKLWLTGIFMFAYMRTLHTSRPAAMLSAIAWSLSAFMVVWLGHPHVNSVMWLPLLLNSIERFLAPAEPPPAKPGAHQRPPRHAPRVPVGAVLALAMMLYGGHWPTVILMLAGAALYAMCRAGNLPGIRRICAPLLTVVILGTMLAAPQILPFLEYYSLSALADASATTERWMMRLPAPALALWLTPKIAGIPAAGHGSLMAAFGSLPNFNETACFVGVMALGLAAVAVFVDRRRLVRLCAAALAVSMAVIYGPRGGDWLFNHVPVINGINYTRLLLWAGFLLAVLAGLGLDRVVQLNNRQRRGFILAGGGVTLLLLAWLAFRFRGVWRNPDHPDFTFLMTQLMIFLISVIAYLLVLALSGRIRPNMLKGAAATVLAVELLWFGMGYNPTIARDRHQPVTPAIQALQSGSSLFRILGVEGAFPPNLPMAYGLHDVRGQDFMIVRRYERLIRGTAGYVWFYSAQEELPPMLEMLNVRYVVAPPETRLTAENLEHVFEGDLAVYRAPWACERVVVPRRWEVVKERPDAPERLLWRVRHPRFDVHELALIEDAPRELGHGGVGGGEARVATYANQRVVIEVEASRPSMVILLDTWFPGWQVRVNSEPAAMMRANYNFRAIAVPEGRSVIDMRYRPASFTVGCALALAGLAVMMRIVGSPEIRHPRNKDSVSALPDGARSDR